VSIRRIPKKERKERMNNKEKRRERERRESHFIRQMVSL
jgi:hypothetical protein